MVKKFFCGTFCADCLIEPLFDCHSKDSLHQLPGFPGQCQIAHCQYGRNIYFAESVGILTEFSDFHIIELKIDRFLGLGVR